MLSRWSHNQAARSGPAVRVLRDAATDAQRSRLPQMAAALSYRTLFGLLPVIVVGLIVINAFTSPDTKSEVVHTLLDKLGISSISVRESSAPGPLPGILGGDAPATPAPGAGDFVGPVPLGVGAHAQLDEWVASLIARAGATVNLRAIGLIGLATLIYAAISMLVEIERAFNQIFRVPRGRSWFRRLTNYWTLLTLGTGALVATFYVGARFEDWVQALVQSRGWTIGSGAITVGLIGYVVTVGISTLLLLMAYMVVPNTRVRVMPALCGALIAAVLWEAGKWGFTQWVDYSTSYARLYGSIALIPLFLLWIYLTWTIVLFGLQITYQLQHGLANTRPQPISDLGPMMIEPAAALSVMAGVARAFAQGKQPSASELAKSATLPEAIVNLVLGVTSERGLTLRIDRPEAAGGSAEPVFTLSRPPAAISAAEVLDIGFALSDQPGAADPTVRQLRQAQVAAAGNRSLADVANLSTVAAPVTPGSDSTAQPGTLAGADRARSLAT